MNGPKILFNIPILGGIPVTETIRNSWIIIGVVFLLCVFLTSDMKKVPKGKQVIAEKFVTIITDLVVSTMGKRNINYAPYIGTLLVFSFLSSMSSLIGMRPPTADFNTTLGWAIVTFTLVQFNGIRTKGIFTYLKGFSEPVVVITPLNIISEFSNVVSLSFRHFGNIAAGLVITQLLYQALAALTSIVFFGLKIPILQIGIPAVLSIYFDVFTSAIQAFIFCMLTMVFVSMGMADEVPEVSSEQLKTA